MHDADLGGTGPSPDAGAARPPGGPLPDLAARIAVDVQSCPLIAGLHGGPLDRIVTPTGAGRLVGVRMDGDVVEIGVVRRAGADPDLLAEQVRAAVVACVPVARVDVSIAADLDPETGDVVDGGGHGDRPGV